MYYSNKKITKKDLIWLRLAMVDEELPKPVERPKINIPINRNRIGLKQKERDDINDKFHSNYNNNDNMYDNNNM